MRVTHETPVLDFCEEGRQQFWRSKAWPGLSAEIHVSHTDGPLLRVSTGGYLHAKYVPEGTHAPVQTQATYSPGPDGTLVERSLSVTFEYGAQPAPVPDELRSQVGREAATFVTTVVTCSSSFADRWDGAVAAANAAIAAKHQEKVDAARGRVTDALAGELTAILDRVAAQVGAPSPSGRDLAAHPALAELASLIHVADDTDPVLFAGPAQRIVERTTSHLAAGAARRLHAGVRLSEAEFLAAAAATVQDRHPDADATVVRDAVQAAYDLAHACTYGAGFPDAAGAEQP